MKIFHVIVLLSFFIWKMNALENMCEVCTCREKSITCRLVNPVNLHIGYNDYYERLDWRMCKLSFFPKKVLYKFKALQYLDITDQQTRFKCSTLPEYTRYTLKSDCGGNIEIPSTIHSVDSTVHNTEHDIKPQDGIYVEFSTQDTLRVNHSDLDVLTESPSVEYVTERKSMILWLCVGVSTLVVIIVLVVVGVTCKKKRSNAMQQDPSMEQEFLNVNYFESSTAEANQPVGSAATDMDIGDLVSSMQSVLANVDSDVL